MGIRVNVLAKEFGMSSKDLIALCQDKGLVRITKHMNALSEGEVRILRQEIETRKQRAAAKAAAPKPVPPRPAAPAPPKPPASARPATSEKRAAPQPHAAPASAQEAPPGRPSAPTRRPKPPERPPRHERPTRPEARPDIPVDEKAPRREALRKAKPVETKEEAETRRRRPKIKPDADQDPDKDMGMVFTDFTAGGTYSGTMAGAGIGYQRRARRPRPYGRRKRYPGTAPGKTITEIPPEQRKASLLFPVTVRDLSAAIGVKAGDIIRELMGNEIVVTINQPLPSDVVQMIALEHGWDVTVKEQEDIEEELQRAATAESQERLEPRVPVVTMLGHVDHGKTSLLDRIRQTSVAEHEAGGITQHIGAHHVTTPAGRSITFLDTPGHEAFTAMRARGANCTDVVVLVVAADDGVMPQTIEAISHARAAEVPIVIALNKIDLPAADPQRVKPQLANAGIELEEWGGDVPCVQVSAVTGKGIDELLEMILLVAELRNLQANPYKAATGVVLEANLTEGRGAVATVLVREGTAHVGDVVLCGATYGKVRSMHDGRGKSLESAGPSIPVQVSGLNGVPEAGDLMITVADLQKAREVADLRSHRARLASLIERTHVTLENLFGKIAEGQAGEVRVILKADVMGSLEPLKEKLNGLSTGEVKIKIIHSGVGAVNESDVLLADASDAIIIAFRVVADAKTRQLAEERRVDLRIYQIIFQPIDDMRSALSGLLKPERRETVTGHATVKQVFKVSKAGNVAGCQVTDGVIENDSKVRLARDGIVVVDQGRVSSLRRVKEDIRQALAGTECGIKIAGFEDIKEGDVVEAYRVEEIARTL